MATRAATCLSAHSGTAGAEIVRCVAHGVLASTKSRGGAMFVLVRTLRHGFGRCGTAASDPYGTSPPRALLSDPHGTSPLRAAPAWLTRSNRDEGKMPKNTVAAANSSATNAISGSGIAVAGLSGRPASPSDPSASCDPPSASASCDPPSASASCEPPAIGAYGTGAIAGPVIHIVATTRR